METNEYYLENRELLYKLRYKALNSYTWSRKIKRYYMQGVKDYGPMIKDELFKSLFEESSVVGALNIEERLGRSIRIDELQVCPLSVEYLTFGCISIVGNEEEYIRLCEFERLIDERIRKYEGRAIKYEVKALTEKLEMMNY